uniref:Uncharacterized protein n=1 Tax=Bombyx mori TaxID=7091 RepID=A0A8R2R935_BOMMO|nr:uncharacterized protein LOC119630422 isoform X2 [Bombyx mori]
MHQDSCRRAVVDDLDLEPISMYLQSASVHHFENTARHENPLIVAADTIIKTGPNWDHTGSFSFLIKKRIIKIDSPRHKAMR